MRRIGLLLLSPVLACTALTDLDGLQGAGGAAASGTAASSTSSAQGSGTGAGGGGPGECAVPEDCPGWENPCRERTCEMGVCGFHLVANGTPLGSQAAGDCKEVTCDGKGGEVTIFIVDPYDDGTACTVDTCENGAPLQMPVGAGSACDDATGGQICSGRGQCVQCIISSDCPVSADLCQSSICVPPSCVDGMQDGSESDIDCGGAMCAPCADGHTCMSASDCASGVCPDGKCAAPACDDGVENGAETDVDCGAGCAKCKDGLGCALPGDCDSSVCIGLVCKAATCSDGVKNGAESDVDCGAPLPCKPCEIGKKCQTNTNCQTALCTAGLCVDPCLDGIMDMQETDVDCGGGTCQKCKQGQQCKAPTDCAAALCCGTPYGCGGSTCP